MASTDRPETSDATVDEISVSPEEAFRLATERHRAGMLDEAEVVYRTLLEGWPDHADVLNQYGILRHQRGEPAEALTILQRAVDLAPGAPSIRNNLGIVLLRLERIEDGEAAFRRSIALADNAQAQAGLARALRRQKRWADSEAACRRAIELAPEFPDGWHNLALALFGQERVPDGILAASRAMTLVAPEHRRHDTYARALITLGEIDKAADVYRQWQAEDPDNPLLPHQLAACGAGPAPTRASDAYVTKVFDSFAASFDAKLAHLDYRAPQFVAEALAAVAPTAARQFEIADIGCGTGLCGPLVRDRARRLAGCDLSAEMLARAAQREVYDVLDQGELGDWLASRAAAFDVVISADTLCYFGDLGDVSVRALHALRAGGWFIFTVEALHDAGPAPFRLNPNGRYAHARAYVDAMLDAAGFASRTFVDVALRNEQFVPVRGWLVTAGRAA